jgi:beta-phosphoglucomutase-like phosphatase (HAD superfamily)
VSKALKLAVFDVDGTLVDSRQIIHDAMDRAFARAGLGGIEYDRVRTIVGLELTEAVLRLAPADYPAERVPELATYYKQAFIEMRAEDGFSEPLYEGARWAWPPARRGGGWTSCSAIMACTAISRRFRPSITAWASPTRAWCWTPWPRPARRLKRPS